MKINIIFLLILLTVACQRHGVVSATGNNVKKDTSTYINNGSVFQLSSSQNSSRKNKNTLEGAYLSYPNFSKDTLIYERTTNDAFDNPKYKTHKVAQKYDTSKSGSSNYNFWFLKQKQLISFFNPYFDKEICEPSNYKNATYKIFKRTALQSVSEMK